MLIRQEEETPVGDYYHDYRIEPLFNEVKSTVDEFEFDSEVLKMNIETLMTRLKGLRNFIVSLEKMSKIIGFHCLSVFICFLQVFMSYHFQ